MQISKKLYTTLVITLLAISTIVAAIPMASAAVTGDPVLYAPGSTTPKTTGPVGSKVTVAGVSGNGLASPFTTVTVTWYDTGLVLGTVPVKSDGTWALNVTIPASTIGAHYIVANDGGGADGVEFTVTPSVKASANRALPNDELVLTGHGYAANSAVTVVFDNGTSTWTLTTPIITTNASGSFSATVTVPSTITLASYGAFTINATDASSNTNYYAVTIDYYITVTPATGPTGITTSIAGRITANTPYALQFNGAAIASGTSGDDGSFLYAYQIPGILSYPVSYSVDVVWATVNSRTVLFNVTAPPSITVAPTSGVAGATIGLTGSGFSGLANITLKLGTTVVNSTVTDERFAMTTITGAIPAGLTFEVPAIAAGVYSVVVEDAYGASSPTNYYFTVTPTPVFEAMTRAVAYTQGDVLSIYTHSTTNPSVDMTITGPDGNLVTLITTAAWVLRAGSYSIPQYQYPLEAITLSADAPLGTYNFTCYTAGTTTILDTNLFTVAAPATLDSVMDGIDEVKDTLADMTDMITDISGDVVTITGDVTDLTSVVSGLDISVLSSDIDSIQMAVADLEAVVTAVAGDVATVSTTIGTLEGTITSIDGNTATIQTDVGTLTADVSDVKANVDNTPAWIAVVLALVAAVAAIFAVITIRQKIAG